ncbi:helix-turn-helix domain-containing protein [Kineosporia sp. J2-2]|uniref:Helix-turn-helix domain-containing protein n=1 Tax=Kineosporia corallincola TaxID=2835133 RepID=A0ABS5TBN3_9ACTN|nr:helix-turn-helix transcriptional regulator [Kineosporia corallincola]MBT0768480.1 helix-turn-helix domain-containing protein [Kineosporia corallincola]
MPTNKALSAFLTARRAAITPAQAGVPVTGPRRVPGLRREEVAFLSGVSVDWYVRLEQGRQITPSESVLNAVARTLKLDDAERGYLFNLAGHRPAHGPRVASGAGVRPGVVRMMQALSTQAAFVLGPRAEVLDGNSLMWALIHDFPAEPAHRRNLLTWLLTDPAARELYLDWAVIASDMVGVLQLESSARPGDPRIAALVGELATASREFRTWWAEPHPTGRTAGTKRFRHPVAGPLTVDWEAFPLPDDATQTLFVYTAADPASQEAMAFLARWRAGEIAPTAGS